MCFFSDFYIQRKSTFKIQSVKWCTLSLAEIKSPI